SPFDKQPVQVLLDPKAVREGRVTEIGWEIYPEGLYRLLRTIDEKLAGKYSILISENGIADSSDSQRRKFLEDHLSALADAMAGRDFGSAGDPVRRKIAVEAYCYWTLLDNFEWTSG